MARRNIREDQRDRIEHMLPGKASDSGRSGTDNRQFVEAILWLARAGPQKKSVRRPSGDLAVD